jgi:ubiquinol-cytochrome c reductase cytochrome c subunit
MRNRTSLALLAGAALIAAGAAVTPQAGAQQAASPAAAASPSGNADAGKKLFMADGCWQCHGLIGQGAPSTGPRLAPGPLPYQAFLHQLRQPASDMPPYEAVVLSDQQAADIYAFLGSIPKSPDPKSIPLLGGS